MLGLIRKIIGTKNDREIKRIAAIVDRVNAQEPAVRRLGDAALRGKTVEFRERLAGGATLDELLPEAFAVVREAARRTLGMRHFDVQILGGIVLHEGKIAEMKTGEGKTLVATLPVYLNALPGKGVHLVTVNDYLAKRDSQWMGQVYRFLGLTVGHHPARHAGPGPPARLRLRRHLRHEQRVRLRLPARQHEVLARRVRPARAALRDRRRGRLDPDRRGAHAADHQRAGRGVDRHLLPRRRDRRAAGRAAHHRPGRGQGQVRRHLARGGRRLPRQREEQERLADRAGRDPRLPRLGRGEPARPRPDGEAARHAAGPARQGVLQARRRVRGQQQRGHHRRRVHRPADAGPALERGAAPGGRGPREPDLPPAGARRRGEPDPRDDHLPELLPPLRASSRA